MRLPVDPGLPIVADDKDYPRRLNLALTQWLRNAAYQCNLLADGALAAITNARTSAPTTGSWQQGDFVRNSAPVEAGVALSKYVIFGWVAVSSGTPGTWLECRFLTGN